MEFKVDQIVWTCALGFASIAGWIISVAISSFLKRIEDTLERGTQSMERLNVNVAVVVSKVESHERRITLIEEAKRVWERETPDMQAKRVSRSTENT